MSKSWPMVPLGEVLTERKETPDSSDIVAGKIKIISKIGFNDGLIQLRSDGETKTGMILIRPGDLVLSGINAAKGAIAIYGEENTAPIAATIHYGSYIPNKDKVDIRYLWWLLRSNTFRELLQEYVPGGIKTELKAKRLLPIPVPLPPLPEQRRIVARIEQLAAKIEEARLLRQHVIEEGSILRRRALAALLQRVPSERKPLSELLSEPMLNGLSLPALKIGTGITFAKVGAVNTGVFNPLEIKQADVGLPEDSPYWLRKGDILVSRGNAVELVGRAAVYEGNPPNCAMPDLLIRIRVQRDKIDPHFLSEFFHSAEAREYIESQISGTSSTMPKISQPKLGAMPVPVPPLTVQRKIVGYLDGLQAKVETMKRLQAEAAAELDALLPSILDKAFKGELKIPLSCRDCV